MYAIFTFLLLQFSLESLAAIHLLATQLANAPEAYQDDSGFHVIGAELKAVTRSPFDYCI